MERLYAFLIFGENSYARIAETLRVNYKEITTFEINEFVCHFRKTHIITVVTFKYDDIPLYATKKRPLYLPNPFSYTVTLTLQEEQELLCKIINEKESVSYLLERWFVYSYINKYRLESKLKEDISIQGRELARSFCEQHGIDIDSFPKSVEVKALKPTSKSIKTLILILLWVAIAIGIIFSSNNLDGFFSSFIVASIGFGMLGLLLKFLFGNHK